MSNHKLPANVVRSVQVIAFKSQAARHSPVMSPDRLDTNVFALRCTSCSRIGLILIHVGSKKK